MVPSFYSQYSPYIPQGLFGQFAGVPGAGLAPVSPALFGQPGAYGSNGALAYPPGLVGVHPFNGLTNPIFASPFATTPFVPSPFVSSPFAATPFATSPFVSSPFLAHPAQQILPLLGQLAQQFCIQGVASQQIGTGLYQLYQLAHQLLAQPLAMQGITTQPFIGAGQTFGLGAPFVGAAVSPYISPTAFAATAPGTFGITPQQAQAWGATRPQTTIQ